MGHFCKQHRSIHIYQHNFLTLLFYFSNSKCLSPENTNWKAKKSLKSTSQKSVFPQKSLYSYLQYHWCALVFKEMEESTASSVKYNKYKDAAPILVKIKAGAKIQIDSNI